MPMLSSVNLKLDHMCGYVGLRGGTRGRGGANDLREMGQLIFSMVLEWREACPLAQKATTASKGFSFENLTC